MYPRAHHQLGGDLTFDGNGLVSDVQQHPRVLADAGLQGLILRAMW